MVSLTESSYFAPSFVEFTSMEVDENVRQMKEHGLVFPIGMSYIHFHDPVAYAARF